MSPGVIPENGNYLSRANDYAGTRAFLSSYSSIRVILYFKQAEEDCFLCIPIFVSSEFTSKINHALTQDVNAESDT